MNNHPKPIRIVTVSGRIASGSTSLGRSLAEKLGWKHISGGEIFWKARQSQEGFDAAATHLRPDQEDILFDEELKKTITQENHVVVETKLAGFNAQGVEGVYKILVICEDKDGNDQMQIRIDRLINREGLSSAEAKREVMEREQNDLGKWSKLYADGDPAWTFYDPAYFDLIINTYDHNQEETVKIALDNIDTK